MRSIRPPLSLAALTLIGASIATAQDLGRTTLGGYGEVHFTNVSGPRTPATVNVKRFVLFLGHAFNERITLRSELELEDTKLEGGEEGGELALEQAFLDYRLSDALSVRTGLLLVPVGIVNEIHEPPSFHGVARPQFDREVLPTTWREIGVGLTGSLSGGSGLNYRVYLVSGLDAAGFSGSGGIRGGRQEGKEASNANPSVTGRLEWSRAGLRLGGSFWYGGSAAQDSVLGGGTFGNSVGLLSADVRIDVGALALRGVAARISVSDADRINARFGRDVGSLIAGGYLEAAVNLLRLAAPSSSQALAAFARHERYDLHAGVPAGTTRDPSVARRITTIGLTYKPIWNVAFKADFQLRRSDARAGQDEVLSLGMGYQF